MIDAGTQNRGERRARADAARRDAGHLAVDRIDEGSGRRFDEKRRARRFSVCRNA